MTAADRSKVIDQRLLPHDLVIIGPGHWSKSSHAIREMVVRGRPADRGHGAYGLC